MSDVWNDALERAALAIESLAGNEKYEQAWRVAAKRVRDLKKVPDSAEQIGSESTSDGETLSPVVKAGAR